jgi:hypothetical protein
LTGLDGPFRGFNVDRSPTAFMVAGARIIEILPTRAEPTGEGGFTPAHRRCEVPTGSGTGLMPAS